MTAVASLRYGVIFKKAFSVPEIFTAFVEDLTGAKMEVDKVETEKSFDPPIGQVDVKFDLFAEDRKNRIVVDIQHERSIGHYDRFLHYHRVALLEQISNAENYRPRLAVYTIVVLTSGDKHHKDMTVIDFDPHDLQGKPLGEIPHKVIYLCPKYVNSATPEPLREWLAAIDDSLDETVEASHYTRPEIRRIFEIIQKDRVTPQERAQMIEESHQEELKQDSFTEGRAEGRKSRELEIVRAMFQQGMALEAIALITGLTADEVAALLDDAAET